MIQKYDIINIENLAEKMVRSKYDIIKDYCSAVFIKQGYVRLQNKSNYIGLGHNDVFVLNATTSSAYIANKIYMKFKSSVNVVHVYTGTYKLLLDGFVFYMFWEVPKPIFESFFYKHGKIREVAPDHAFLICLYRNLYNPGNVDDLFENLKLVSTINKKNIEISGDGESRGIKPKIDKSIKKLLSDCVFVGTRAFKYFECGSVSTVYEVICDNVEKLCADIAYAHKNVKIDTQSFPILNDFMFTRTSVSLNGRDICYIYNSAQYELIPFFNMHDYKIGCLYVVARFAIINIWIIKFFIYNKKLDKIRGKKLIAQYKGIHEDLINRRCLLHTVVPPINKYYGVGVDERIIYKQMRVKDKDYKPKRFYQLHKHLLFKTNAKK
jgi:hypothetical protein